MNYLSFFIIFTIVVINLSIISFESFYMGVMDFYYCLIMSYIIKYLITKFVKIDIIN
jgi:hypothetical protein